MDQLISVDGLWIGGEDVVCGSMEVDRWISAYDKKENLRERERERERENKKDREMRTKNKKIK